MSRKYCTKHPERGAKPNHGRFESMASLTDLRRTQGNRERQTGSPWPEPWQIDEPRLKFIRSWRMVPEGLSLRTASRRAA